MGFRFDIDSITPASSSGGGSSQIESLNVTPTTSAQTITAPSGVDGYNPINVSAVTSSIDNNIIASNIVSGVSILGVNGSATVLNGETINITPTTSQQIITPTNPKNGITQATVAAVTASIDANIVAENIKKDVPILGVVGTLESGGSSGKYSLLDRVSDDNGNEIGTVSGFFTDTNNVEYAVVWLDAQYRLNSGQWCSNASTVTNMPMYNNMQSSNIWTAKETATQNTQWILDYCSTKRYSSGCTHCRNQSFVIGGITYYGQLPNILELIDIAKLYNEYNSLWSSSQYGTTAGYMVQNNGTISSIYKTNSAEIFPILEIPNN